MNFDDLLNDAGKEIATTQTEVDPGLGGELVKASSGESLQQMYDRTKQTIFVIDISGSQGGQIAQSMKETDFNWPAEFLDDCRKLRAQWFARREVLDMMERQRKQSPLASVALTDTQRQLYYYSTPFVFSQMKDGEEHKWKEQYAKSGTGIYDRPGYSGVYTIEFDDVKVERGAARVASWVNAPVLKPEVAVKVKLKIDAIKTAGRAIIEKRFEKYGRSAVSVMLFNTECQTTTYPYAQYGNNGTAVRDAVIATIDRASPSGGTDIMKALREAIRIAKRSGQKNHHILLCTDGADYGAKDAMTLLPEFQEWGIMLDFILVLGLYEEENNDEARKALTDLCVATNGAFQVATTEETLVSKLVEAHTRLALPPAPTKLEGGNS